MVFQVLEGHSWRGNEDFDLVDLLKVIIATGGTIYPPVN